MLLRQLVARRAVVDEVHPQPGGDEAQRGADLRAVPHEHHLHVLQALALGQMLEDGTHIPDLLRGVVVVGHSVEYRDGAGLGQLHDGPMLDDTGHHHIHQTGQHLAGIPDGLVASQLDHSRPQILGVAAHLAHGCLEGDTGTGGGLLEDHAQCHVLHQGRIVPAADGPLDGKAQLDHIHQLLPCELICVDEIFHHSLRYLLRHKMETPIVCAAGSGICTP